MRPQEWEIFLDQLHQCQTRDALESRVLDLRDLFGLEHVVYHCVNSVEDQYGILTYDPDWVEHYIRSDYLFLDPVVRESLHSFDPVEWKSLNWKGPTKKFLFEALDAGIGAQGVSVPIRGPDGQFALFTANSRAGDEEWAAFNHSHREALLIASHFFHERAQAIDNAVLTAIRPLSPRERDVLSFLARGAARGQVAERLGISEHTLRAYIDSARAKLGAANTTHAVAIALTRGEILP